MGAVMESVFCVAYLIVTFCLGIMILRRDKLFGALTLVLVCGDAFHLVPRIMGNLSGTLDTLKAALGLGTLITSVTMTVFYVLLAHYFKAKRPVLLCIYALAAVRIALCAFPQNEWLTGGNLTFGIIRNVPFVLLGAAVVWLLFLHRDKKNFKLAWLSVTLSFLFYIPVVLFADVVPIVGMLMLPKTVCYVWLVVMGYKAVQSS